MVELGGVKKTQLKRLGIVDVWVEGPVLRCIDVTGVEAMRQGNLGMMNRSLWSIRENGW